MSEDSMSIQNAPGYDENEIEPMRPNSRLAEAIVMAVAELPDRTSPEDWPAAMLVTADELMDIVDDHLSAPQALLTIADEVVDTLAKARRPYGYVITMVLPLDQLLEAYLQMRGDDFCPSARKSDQ
jgi:hypothetical protein